MAGIGFELKRLFTKKGMLATVRAYGYAGIVCTGPMLLGVILLLGVMFLCQWSGAVRAEQELLVSMITYALLASLTLTSIFSMLTTRCTADMLYINDYKSVIPTFYGSLGIMLLIGSVGYGIFLHFAGIPFPYRVLCFLLFVTLVVVWTEINYLTALKDYRSIFLAFFTAIATAFLIGFLLIWLFRLPAVPALLAAVCCGYGVMMVWYFRLIHQYFPDGFGTSFRFLKWFDQFPQLALIGFFVTLGLFGHLVLMWMSPMGVQIQGLFYGAPSYDVPALMAFFSILITTINFVTSVEVRFYPQYRDYFSLFNDGGNIGDIEEAEKNMIRVLKEELGYLAQKQLFFTILFIVFGSFLLPSAGMGFNSEMLGIFRVLCVGYAFYAIGNSLMLLSLYFADNKGALISASVFAGGSNLLTILFMNGSSVYYGFGFLIGSAVFCLTAWIRLSRYLTKLKYHILSRQPIFLREHTGAFTRLSDRLDAYAHRRQRRRHAFFEKHQGKGEKNV